MKILLRGVCIGVLAAAAVAGCMSGGKGEQGSRRTEAGGRAEPVQNPEEARRWRRLAWRDEHGNLPAADAMLRALEERELNLLHWREQPGPLNGGIWPSSWTFRGPSNIGGRTRSLLIHPTQTNRLWAGSVGGGIWSSQDAGATWVRASDQLPNLAIGCLAMDPTNPGVMYAGTGEGYFNGDALGGVGIYRSTDGGATWTLMPSTAGWDNVCRIAISPADPNVLLVGKRYGGILRSNNGGATWTTRYWAQGSYQVAFHPTDGSRAIGHVIDYDFSTGQWFHRAMHSTDGGLTWAPALSGLTRVNDFNSRIELAYARSSPNIVYANCGADGGRIWKSIDGGLNYTRMTTSGRTDSGWYYNAVWVSPTDPDLVVAAGYAITRSVDGGVSLTQISDGYILTTQPHPDVHGIYEDPGYNGTTNRRVYVVTDGGVHRTDDITTASRTGSGGWVNLQPTYETAQYYGAAGHGPSGRIVGGTQDNGTTLVNMNGPTAASLVFGGDGGFCAIDPADANFMYGEYITLQIFRSTDGGASAGYIVNGLADAGTAANFIAPFILDANLSNVMYAGGRSLWKSFNVKSATPTWTAIRGPGNDNISAIASARGQSNILWIGLNNGEVYRTSNSGSPNPTWIAVDNNAGTNPLPNRYVTRIVIDPGNHARVYVAFGGFSPANVWRTTDNGATFASIGGTAPAALPSAPVRGLCRHPTRPGWLYAGTEVGVFATSDDGATWSASNDGPANVSVDEIVFLSGSETLLLATHGRGLWTAPVIVCPADFNRDGRVDFFDYLDFVQAFSAGSAEADFNRDGRVDFFDYLDFVQAFSAGC